MIFDHIETLKNYQTIIPETDLILHFLKDFRDTGTDRIELSESLFCLINRYIPKMTSVPCLETHRCHADLQLMITGKEMIRYQNIKFLREKTAYVPEKDIAFHDSLKEPCSLILNQGCFAFFSPWDGHEPGLFSGENERILKLVFKIRLNGG